MLSNIFSLKVFLVLLLLSFSVTWSSEEPHVEIGYELTPQQLISKISEEDKASLTQYFRMMLLESEGGYVLFGIKPICLESIESIDSRPKSNLGFHPQCVVNSEAVRKGLEAWNRLPISKEGAPIEIIVYKQPDHPFYDCRHVLWLHRKAFLEAVTENLTLFKSILGQETTPESLLVKLCNPDASFFSTLDHNKILIGIVLGFGVENAIHGSRLEIINDAMRQVERPPLARRSSRAGITLSPDICPGLEPHMPLKGNEPRPSIGFETLSEEHDALQAQLALSTELVDRSSPTVPLFACLKENNQAAALLARYAGAQAKIKSLLSSSSFLEDIFTLILSDKPRPVLPKAIATYSLPNFEAVASRLKNDNSNSDLADQVTLMVWDNLMERDHSYVDRFMAGMRAAENDRRDQKGPTFDTILLIYQPIIDCVTATVIRDGYNNVAEGEKAIKAMAEEPSTIEIIFNKLYYKIVQHGRGPKLTVNHDRATTQYLLYYLGGRNSGKLLASSQSDELNISELIPGLAHGILGMQAGEIREIHIHPDYAYGFQSNFEPGIAISARVELISLPPTREGSSIKFPLLRPVDKGLTDFPSQIDDGQMEELQLKAAHAEGYSAWCFYGRSDDLYSLNDVLESLQLRVSKSKELDTTKSNFIPSDLLRVLYERQDKLLL